MQIIEDYRDFPDALRGAHAAMGNFDGVHKGHQVLITAAADSGTPVAVISFEPHPRRLFQPDAPPFRLSTAEEKARRLAEHDVDLLINLPFDTHMAGMTAETFVREVLHAGLGLSHVVVGADFRFGKGRQGDAVMLRQLGTELDMGVTIHQLIGDEAGEFASTAVRVMVSEGRCEDAARALGRWHTVSGPVVQGDQRGATSGIRLPISAMASS